MAKKLTTEERGARMDQAYEKHLRGETVTLDDFLSARQDPDFADSASSATAGGGGAGGGAGVDGVTFGATSHGVGGAGGGGAGGSYEAGRAAERARVVAWLAAQDVGGRQEKSLARAIERGEHLR